MTLHHNIERLLDPAPRPRTTDGIVHPVTVRHIIPKPVVR